MPREHEKHESENKGRRGGGKAREVKARNARGRAATVRKTKTPEEQQARQVKAPRASSSRLSSSHVSSSHDSRASSSASGTRPAPSPRPTVTIIGAGRVGCALARALGRSGYHVAALVARRVSHARLAARALSPRPLALDAASLNLLPDTDLILVTTPDGQIAGVAAALAEALAAQQQQEGSAKLPRRRRPQRVALHASGALSSDTLAPLGAHDFSLGSLHPLVSISDSAAAGARNLRGAFYCLEGERGALRAAGRIVRALGGRSFSLAARDKSLYHAAAVITSGHTVALFSLAADLLARCGLSDARARRVLLPLLASTHDNLRAHPPEEALTGTFARADLDTVRKHLAALEDAGGHDALAVYALLGARSLELAARRRNATEDPSVRAEIASLLATIISGQGQGSG